MSREIEPIELKARIALIESLGVAERNTATARLKIKTQDNKRLLLLRRRGFGSTDFATYTDLAGSMILDLGETLELLQSLKKGSIAQPELSPETDSDGWYQDEFGAWVCELHAKSMNNRTYQQWVDGYIIQQITDHSDYADPICDARVAGFQSAEEQAKYELAVEAQSDWEGTIAVEIEQEIEEELPAAQSTASKYLSGDAVSNWPSYSQDWNASILLKDLSAALQELAQNTNIISRPVEFNRMSGKTNQLTHTIDQMGEVTVEQNLIDEMLAAGWVTDLSHTALAGQEGRPTVITTPFILISEDVLAAAKAGVDFQQEEVATAVRFGDKEPSLTVSIGSNVFY